MARVNHGSLLQHAIECEVALRLADGAAGLRLVCTHAMAPFEGPREAALHEHNRGLRDLLGTIACMPPGAEDSSTHALVRAYAQAGARVERYPNTAELLAALLGRERLTGLLCEVDPAHVEALAAAWKGTAMAVEGRSWREVLRDGALLPPADLARPWLITVDPYTWKHDGECKKEELGPHLARADLEALRPMLAAHVRSGVAGAFLAFVYKLDPSHAKGFRNAVLHLGDRLGVARAIVGVAGPDGTRHLGAVLSPEPDLPAEVAEAWHGMAGDLGLA